MKDILWGLKSLLWSFDAWVELVFSKKNNYEVIASFWAHIALSSACTLSTPWQRFLNSQDPSIPF